MILYAHHHIDYIIRIHILDMILIHVKNTSNLGRSAWIDVEHAPSSSRTSDDEALHRLGKVALQKAFLVQGKVGFNGREKRQICGKLETMYICMYICYII